MFSGIVRFLTGSLTAFFFWLIGGLLLDKLTHMDGFLTTEKLYVTWIFCILGFIIGYKFSNKIIDLVLAGIH